MKKNKDEGSDLPEFMEKIKHENPFIVPHNYFRELPDQILDQIKKEEMATSIDVSWLTRLLQSLRMIMAPRPILALATVVLLVGGVLWWSQNQQEEALLASQDLDRDEIIAYIQANLDEFNESDFYTDDAASADPLEQSFDDDDIDPILQELIDEVDVETLEDIL